MLLIASRACKNGKEHELVWVRTRQNFVNHMCIYTYMYICSPPSHDPPFGVESWGLEG